MMNQRFKKQQKKWIYETNNSRIGVDDKESEEEKWVSSILSGLE